MTYEMKLEEEREFGREEGRAEGREARSEEMALAMLQEREPLDKIVKYTLLSIEHIKKIGRLHSLL